MSEERPPAGPVLCPLCESRQSPNATVCGRCGRYFTYRLDPDDYRASDADGPPRRTEIEQTRRWFSWGMLGVSAMLVVIGLGLGSGLWTAADRAGWVTVLMALGSLALFYLALVLVVNRTKIRASGGRIRVTRGPLWLPLADSFSLGAGDIERIDVWRVKTSTDAETITNYGIKLFTRKGDVLDVLELDDEREALAMCFDLETILKLEPRPQPEQAPRQKRAPPGSPEEDRGKVQLISRTYCAAIPGYFVLSFACLLYPLLLEDKNIWRFDLGFAVVFAAFTAILFCIFYFHHRKYLSWLDSKPRGENEKPGPTAAYVILVLITAAFGLPIAMLCYYFLVPPAV
ncbi:MAG: hypothetical protein ACYTFI_08240 [Planctomycetota bacterium]|jgi:hypothetical protein